MSKPFKLRSTLLGHSLDVRSVTTTSDNSIISGSRDKTAKYWSPTGFGGVYNETMTYRDQKNFVMCVLYLEPTPEFPTGLVVTGGNDNTILVYQTCEPFATFTLKEHTNAVCSLSAGLEGNSFLSGSWDSTAKFWVLGRSNASLVTFTGHSAAVWSVIQLHNSNVVTASADKLIGIWNMQGQRLKTLQGHTDCVRGLADFSELNYFVSVSNDASIKVWTYGGDNVDTYYGHTNYIYSIARNKTGGELSFVTSDEDRTVRYWENGVNTETFLLPAQSVWSVACLNNGDVVTGSSDGVVRIFTQDEGRYASEDALKTYSEEVAALSQQSQQEIGGVKVSDLPGREALYDPGKKAGQMKMIREPHGVVAYTWVEDGNNSHWEKVGDVLGGTDKDNAGKTMFEGKAYDYVFSVDVEDGKPPLKLPYNTGDDPYKVAQEFLVRNGLPTAYLEQVVDFILKNCKEAAQSIPNSNYVDPFVGSSRYVPGSRVAGTTGSASSLNCDPFTGGSSYTTNSGGARQTASAGFNSDPFTGGSSYSSGRSETNSTAETNFFPLLTYRLFETGDANPILGKIKEFNQKVGDSSGTINENLLEEVVKLCNGPSTNDDIYDILYKLLQWPDDNIFPVLDVLRLAIRFEKNNHQLCTKYGSFIIDKLKNYISDKCRIPNNTLLSLRVLTNLCASKYGEELLFENKFDLLESITTLGPSNKNIQVALATFLLNISILTLKRNDEIGISVLADVLPDVLTNLEDPEAQFRAYVALGTLFTSGNVQQNREVKLKAKENGKFLEKLEANTTSYNNDIELKRKNCALQIQHALNS